MRNAEKLFDNDDSTVESMNFSFEWYSTASVETVSETETEEQSVNNLEKPEQTI